MRIVKIVVPLIFISWKLYAQVDIEKNALVHVNKMALYYNNKDFTNYMNCLLPAIYGNNPEIKEKIATFLKSAVSDSIHIVKVLKPSIKNNQYQTLYINRYQNKDSYIFGVSDDKGKNWLFTTTYTNEVQFEQIQEIIPSIDTSFAGIVDPRFGKRIRYEIGKMIDPFKFTDIYGNTLSSEALEGKVIVMNFWGITCGPCIKEIPELNGLVEKMKNREVVFIAPAIYTPKEILINNFLPKHPFNYQIVLINQNDYSITSFPTHILIDKNLKVRNRWIGYSQDNIKNLEQQINELSEERFTK